MITKAAGKLLSIAVFAPLLALGCQASDTGEFESSAETPLEVAKPTLEISAATNDLQSPRVGDTSLLESSTTLEGEADLKSTSTTSDESDSSTTRSNETTTSRNPETTASAPENTDTPGTRPQGNVPVTGPTPGIPQNIDNRLYPDWCKAGASSTTSSARSSTGSTLQAKVDEVAGNGGGVITISGTHTISAPLVMKSNVVIKGSPTATIQSGFGGSQNSMIQFQGGGSFQKVGSVTTGDSFSKSITASVRLSPGMYMVGEAEKSGGQIVRVTSASGNTGQLEMPLSQSFSGRDLYRHNSQFIEGAGLENLAIVPRDQITDVILLKTSTNVTLKNLSINGAGGQQKAAIFATYSYKNSIVDNTISDAAQLGDGGRGYGINVANASSNNLIAGNRLSKLRHSMLLNTGAAANVFRNNHSSQARHPNFQNGGPADMSFHGYASGNLIEANTLLRTHIGDDSVPGPNNTIAFNTFTSGPLTIQGDDGNPLHNVTIIGNEWSGTPDEMYQKLISDASAMQPIPGSKSSPSLDSPRKLWTGNDNPFAGPSSGDIRLKRGVGILDLDAGQGNDIFVAEEVGFDSICS